MAEIVNLRRARKAKVRAGKAEDGDASRARHGVAPALRKREQSLKEMAAKRLESMRLDKDK